MARKTVLAVDLGAESGRVMAVHFDGSTLSAEELHRFPNVPVLVRDTLHWDVLRLWQEIQEGLRKGLALQPASLGVDTWGVDFALLDAHGGLLANPVHYRDRRTEGVYERVCDRLGRAMIFERTGIQFMPINTLYQLASLAERRSPLLSTAARFLTIPDLLNYWLTGAQVCEFSNATTTQAFNPRTGDWAVDLLQALEIPSAIFPQVVQPGTSLGSYQGMQVIAPACHDTGSAVAGVPAATPHYAYISSGTWSLVGLEVDRPVIDSAALEANVTNEGGVYGSFRLLKNVMGLWIVQQCRATWQAQGFDYSYADMVRLAEEAEPLRSLIAPNDVRFLPPGDHPALVQQWCRERGQAIPDSHGAVLRAVLESLALAYREILESLQRLSGRSIEVLHVIGGGSRNELLCQMTADASGIPVLAGPVEATVLGNALVQLITLGELRDLGQARELVARSSALRRYEPRQSQAWQEAYLRFRQQ